MSLAKKVGELERTRVVPARVIREVCGKYNFHTNKWFWRRLDPDTLVHIHVHLRDRNHLALGTTEMLGKMNGGLGTTEVSARSYLLCLFTRAICKTSASTMGSGGQHTVKQDTVYSTATTCNQVREDVTARSQAFQPQRNELPLCAE